MSFDLAFWCQKSVPTAEEAAQIYDQLADGLSGVVEASSAVEDFHKAVISVFPDLAEENMDESPWTSPLYVTSECVIATISWSRAGEVSSVLLDLASRYRLTTYDPQEQVVYGITGEASSGCEVRTAVGAPVPRHAALDGGS
ncbi:hypothetical protein ACQP2T_54585 [Nonomuraea sp. CA-143628]|uniref:hypothetical protein n=1 Tax=Nonomuraea sp. CA-143628 TaxID=3239997 RepID=UPI003D8B5479